MAAQLDTIIKESAKRMKKMKFKDKYVNDFINDGKVYLTDCLYFNNKDETAVATFVSEITENNDKEEIRLCHAKIKELEDYFGFKIFHVIHTPTTIGEMYSYIYTSQYANEWSRDNELIDNSIVYSYVENRTDDVCSEIGSIGWESLNGTIIRTD